MQTDSNNGWNPRSTRRSDPAEASWAVQQGATGEEAKMVKRREGVVRARRPTGMREALTAARAVRAEAMCD